MKKPVQGKPHKPIFKQNIGLQFISGDATKQNLEQLFSCPNCARSMTAKSTILPSKSGLRFRMHCDLCTTNWEYAVAVTEL